MNYVPLRRIFEKNGNIEQSSRGENLAERRVAVPVNGVAELRSACESVSRQVTD